MSDGFVDLRQNQGQLVDESFWPSFTDIMTVVVMIFLIATSILIVKNWELVNELQARIKAEQKITQRLKATTAAQQKTSQELLASQDKRYQIARKLQLSIEAERRTSEVIQKTSMEKASLEERLAHIQSELSLTRLQLMQAGESAAERDRLITEQDKQISHLTEHKKQLNQQLKLSKQQIAQAQQELTSIDLTMNSLQGKLELNSRILKTREQQLQQQLTLLTGKEAKLKDLSEQNKRYLANIRNYEKQVVSIRRENVFLSEELEQQHELIVDKDTALAQLNEQNQAYLDNINSYKEQIALAQQQHSGLTDEYKTLEKKYNKLIKPSRSAVGKYVVEVRYEKLAGKKIIQYRPSGQEDYQTITTAVLHKKLSQLKQKYKESLYVKIIIPDDSGLSYNEAWTFMLDILNKYDYYYQNE